MFELATKDNGGRAPEIEQLLDEVARAGAPQRMRAALELQVEQYVHAVRHVRDEEGHVMVVRKGKSHHERTVDLVAGPISLRTPRVHDWRPDYRFASKILPPYVRRSRRLDARAIGRVERWPRARSLAGILSFPQLRTCIPFLVPQGPGR